VLAKLFARKLTIPDADEVFAGDASICSWKEGKTFIAAAAHRQGVVVISAAEAKQARWKRAFGLACAGRLLLH